MSESEKVVQEGGELVSARVREMREVMEFTTGELAEKLGIDEAKYIAYEKGEATIPVSTLYALAGIFRTDFTTLLTGEAPRMGGYALVRAGKGVKVDRNPEYHFQSLAFNFKGRTMEPMIVELTPGEKAASLVCHSGQEFNLVLEGRLKLLIGSHEFVLEAGDSIYFDPTLPHAQHVMDVPCKFLTVIQ